MNNIETNSKKYWKEGDNNTECSDSSNYSSSNNSNSDSNDSNKTDQKLSAIIKNSKNRQMQVKKKG
eukprot:238646-Ditylum_brightwellii.AAC.1